MDVKAMRRAAMDYGSAADVVRHADFAAFMKTQGRSRIILATTKGAKSIEHFEFKASDILLFGRESAGAPDSVHAASDHGVLIPMAAGARSLNLANSASIMLFEALRQTGGLAT